MGVRVRVKPEDLAAGQLVEPGWYPLEIKGYEERPAKTDGSVNSFISFNVLDGKFKGARIRHMINEKYGWLYEPQPALLQALGAKVTETGIDIEINEHNIVGKKVDGYIKRGKSDKDKPFNELADVAPIGKMTKFGK